VVDGRAVQAVEPKLVARFGVPLRGDEQFSNLGGNLIALSPDGKYLAYIANRRLNCTLSIVWNPFRFEARNSLRILLPRSGPHFFHRMVNGSDSRRRDKSRRSVSMAARLSRSFQQ
jgi:hypothetical protein